MIIELYKINLDNNHTNIINARLKYYGELLVNNTPDNLYIGFYKNFILLLKLIDKEFILLHTGVNEPNASPLFYFADIFGNIDRIYEFKRRNSRILITKTGYIYYDSSDNQYAHIIVGSLSYSPHKINIENIIKNQLTIGELNGGNYFETKFK